MVARNRAGLWTHLRAASLTPMIFVMLFGIVRFGISVSGAS